jgi:hypothetical protein
LLLAAAVVRAADRRERNSGIDRRDPCTSWVFQAGWNLLMRENGQGRHAAIEAAQTQKEK